MVSPIARRSAPVGQFPRTQQTAKPEATRFGSRGFQGGPQGEFQGGFQRFRGNFTPPQGALDPKDSFAVTQRIRNRQRGGDNNNPLPPSPETSSTGETQGGNSPGGAITEAEVNKAANGDSEISQALMKMSKDPEGAKALRIALDKGTTFKKGELEGNTAGLTVTSSDKPPEITLEVTNTDVVAHEVAHAAYPDMPHEEVYEFGRRVARNLGENPIT